MSRVPFEAERNYISLDAAHPFLCIVTHENVDTFGMMFQVSTGVDDGYDRLPRSERQIQQIRKFQ